MRGKAYSPPVLRMLRSTSKCPLLAESGHDPFQYERLIQIEPIAGK